MNAASDSRPASLAGEAAALHRAGDRAAAEDAYRAALALAPQHPGIWHNLGVLLAETGDHDGAVGCFDRALAGDPAYASAHFNRGAALRALGRDDDARASYTLAVAADPEFYEAHRTLGFLWQAAGNRDRALDHFARTLELRRGEDRTGIADASLQRTTRAKLLHDARQFGHLAAGERPRKPFVLHARAYEAVAATLGDGIVALDDERLEELTGIYNTAYHMVDAPAVAGGALGPDIDVGAVTAEFRARDAGMAWFDGLLSRPALLSLRRYLLESTIWFDFGHIDGFLAAYLEDGLACPLVLQIAGELRASFPAILGDHPLSQAWAFKALDGGGAIDLHVDDGAVSVNFWLTPDGANRVPGRGGLAIYTVPPAGLSGGDYRSGSPAVRTFAAAHEHARETVPYRENRAVLFDSRLVHGSDAPAFAPGYANHRINITMLFGTRGRS